MGIPSFFKWLTDKYPSVIQKGFLEPGQFDNLYIDMNGIVHTSCRLAEGNQYDITEEEMFARINEALQHIVVLVQPTSTIFLALDGVAPRAKLNQQRSRRYEAARHRRAVLESDTPDEDEQMSEERLNEIRDSLDFGVFGKFSELTNGTFDRTNCVAASGFPEQQDEEVTNSLVEVHQEADLLGWDSNCITPGTPFMARLADHLRSFIASQQSCDAHWRKVAVVLSDSNTCGEGEHKIVNFIRSQRCQPTYNPRTKHLVCGSDADFIMLALALHDPYCSILRERRPGGLSSQPDKVVFDVLSMAVLREYLQLEFQTSLKPAGADLERIIDDFVFLCIFVGNDFLPHVPSCFVDAFAIDNLLEIYRTAVPSLGYLTHEGDLDFRRVGQLLLQYAKLEDSQFLREAREQHARGALPDPAEWRDIYYQSIGAAELDRKRMAEEYVRGLSWVILYYSSNMYRSDPTAPPRPVHRKETSSLWRWFYPFHYAPLAHDIADFLLSSDDKALNEIKLYQRQSSRPLNPFCQLLAVLPPDSLGLLPHAYQGAALEDDAPLRDFFPKHYLIDPNGRAQEWKAVVLLPFIDESRLLEVEGELTEDLSPEERRRNVVRHTSHLFVAPDHPLSIALGPEAPGPKLALLPPASGQLHGYVGPDRGFFNPKETSPGVRCLTFLEPPIPPDAALHHPDRKSVV